MRKTRTILASLAAIGVAFAGAGGTAQAAPRPTAEPLAADGYFYAWHDSWQSGRVCYWLGNASDWGACRNQASSVLNNGYAVSPSSVNMYWGLGYSGAYYCLPRGHYLMDMSLDHFNRGSGKAGYGDVMNDNIASSKWTTEC